MESRAILILNGRAYSVIGVKEVKYSRVKRGTIERWLRNNSDPDGWLIYYTDYHVDAKSNDENFNRTFVLTEQEANDILFV